jgi:hypothetical protein
VRLSTRGSVLTNLAFSGKIPRKGDPVYVDYSRGIPIVLTSDTNDNDPGPIEATGVPIIVAQAAPASGAPETVHPRYGNLLYRGVWDDAIDYLENDVVDHENNFYLCIANNLGETPGGAYFWLLFGSSGSPSSNTQQIDQIGDTGSTYGTLSGDRDGNNVEFTVSRSGYVSGTLLVYLNGQLLTQGTSADWHEDTPVSGTFHFEVAPEATDVITAIYCYE